jgi:hypothetical protein
MASSVKDMLAAANSAVPRIQPADLRDRMSKGDVVVVDVRDAPGYRRQEQFTCRAACWSSVPTPKAHTTIPLLRRRRPSFSIAHQAGARHLPEKRCKSLATSRSTMRAPSRIWRERVWRQSQLRSSATTIIPARCKSEFCQMTFEEALAQTMSIVGLLDVGGCRILDTDGFQALLGNAQRQRPIVIIAPRGSACPRPCVLLRL